MPEANVIIAWRRRGEKSWTQREPFLATVYADNQFQVGFPVEFDAGRLPRDWPVDCEPVLRWIGRIGMLEEAVVSGVPWTLFVEAV